MLVSFIFRSLSLLSLTVLVTFTCKSSDSLSVMVGFQQPLSTFGNITRFYRDLGYPSWSTCVGGGSGRDAGNGKGDEGSEDPLPPSIGYSTSVFKFTIQAT